MNKNFNEIDIFDAIDKIDEEAFKIFCTVSSEKDISIYKHSLLKTKLFLLNSMLEMSLEDFYSNTAKKIRSLTRLRFFMILICIINVYLLIKMPIFGIATLIINLLSYSKTSKSIKKGIISYEALMSIDEKVKDLEIEFENCQRFLDAHTNYEIKNREEELIDEDLKMVDLLDKNIKINVIETNEENKQMNIDVTFEEVINNEEKKLKRIKKKKK